MRGFTLFLAVVCIFAFSTNAFAQHNNYQKCTAKVFEVQPVRTAVKGVAKGVAKIVEAKPARTAVKGVGKAIKGVGRRIVDRPPLRRCHR